MTMLSEFIGELIGDIGKARSYADHSAAVLAEEYFSDPFIKNLPIPHYTIDEAEIDVPVIVVGLRSDSQNLQACKKNIVDIITEKMPDLLMKSFKWDYRNEKKSRDINEVSSATYEPLKEDAAKTTNIDFKMGTIDEMKIPEDVKEQFANAIDFIVIRLAYHIEKYIESYNFHIIKLLDLTDEFANYLSYIIKKVKADDRLANIPFYVKDIKIDYSVKYMGNIMFFEFKKIIKSDSNVEVDVSTVKMNEYSSKLDCLMHIKLKIREQDFNLLTEEDKSKKKTIRYLTLT